MSVAVLDYNLIYRAAIEHTADPATIACSCEDCDWKGTADQLAEIESAVLTPGHPSPAGRCPECDTLAYVDQDDLAGMLRRLLGASELNMDATEPSTIALIEEANAMLERLK